MSCNNMQKCWFMLAHRIIASGIAENDKKFFSSKWYRVLKNFVDMEDEMHSSSSYKVNVPRGTNAGD